MAANKGEKEQPLPPYGSCLLGSINLTTFVSNAFTELAEFDFIKYAKVISIFTRMLDNVVEINNLPLEKQREEIYRKRRHGMGFLGLGSTLSMLGMSYGSQKSIEFTDSVSKILAEEGWKAGLELAKEKGAAPIMDEEFEVTEEMLTKRIAMINDGYNIGDTIKGKVLWGKYSKYMNRIENINPELVKQLIATGSRFTHHSSIAPTGTISLSLGNNASNGIEPSFAHHYSRNIIKEGKKSKEKVDVFSYELLAYRDLINKDAMPADLPETCSTTEGITPEEHVDIQAAAQHWIDSSISKCVVEGTRILTNKGIMKVEDLGSATKPGKFSPPIEGLQVYCPDGIMRDVTQHYYEGEKDTIKIRLDNGYILEGSETHKVMTVKGWKQLDQLNIKDVLLRKCSTVHTNEGGKLLGALDNSRTKHKINPKAPKYMTEDLALFLGMFAADGSNSLCNGAVRVHNKDLGIISLVEDLIPKIFGREAVISLDDRTDAYSIGINSKAVSEWLVRIVGNKAHGKFVPEPIMQGSVAEQLAFLRGVSLDGYSKYGGVVRETVLYDGKSQELADGIFSICANIGFRPYKGKKYVKSHNYYVYNVVIDGFTGCIQEHKNSPVRNSRYLVPLPKDIRKYKVPCKHPSYSALRSIKQRQEQQVCWSDTLDSLAIPYERDFDCVKVKEITTGKAKLYDIEVAESHDYLIDGLWSHNTVNVPSDIDFKDFEGIYMYAYDKGLKGCTTYRFNPEVFQGVLVKEDDLKNTNYRFTLEDGHVLEVAGDEDIFYDGESHTAANLFDALKEGYYGKF